MNLRHTCAAAASLIILFGVSSSALALEPAESTSIEMVTISSLYGSISAEDDATLLVGIEGCERALDVDGDIGVNFTAVTNFDPTTPVVTGGIGPYYNNVYYFQRGIDDGNSPSCLAGDADCTALSSSDVTVSSTGIDAQVSFRALTKLQGSTECEISDLQSDYFVRAQFGDGNNASPSQADARIRMDLVRPEPPASFDAVVTEDAIQLTWEDGPSADVETYRIVYSTEQFDGGSAQFPDDVANSRGVTVIASSANSATSSLTTELTPGDVVWVAVSSVDRVGNQSALTAAQPFTVIDTIGFWEAYKDGGGSEEGGYCSAAPHSSPSDSPTPLLGFLGLLMLCATRARRPHGARS